MIVHFILSRYLAGKDQEDTYVRKRKQDKYVSQARKIYLNEDFVCARL